MPAATVEERTMVIDFVQPSARLWENPKGADLEFVSVNFADHSVGSIGVPVGKSAETIAALEALRGVPTQIGLVAKDPYNGTTQWRIAEFPGKPQGLNTGGNRGGSSGGMSHAQAGYMAAASYLAPLARPDEPFEAAAAKIVALGEVITQALFDRKPPAADAAVPAESSNGQTTTVPTDSITMATLRQLKETLTDKGIDVPTLCQQMGVSSLTDLTEEQGKEALEVYQDA